MPRVRIYRSEGLDEEQLRRLLEAAGCADSLEFDDEAEEAAPGAPEEDDSAPGAVNETTSGDDADEVCDPDVLLVVLTPELAQDVGLEPVLRRATNKGCIIIGVWPEGTSAREAPPAFKKYSSDQVIWVPEVVRKAICGGGEEPSYQDPRGEPQPAVTTPRNCC